MGWLTLLGVMIAAAPTEVWLDEAREHFKLPSLEVLVSEEAVVLQLTSFEDLDPATHDHLVASFLATLGSELLGPTRRSLKVVDANFIAWEHEPFEIGPLKEGRFAQAEKHRLRRVRYRGGALDGVHLGLSAGHGIMWDDGVWRYQRSELYELREDLHTNHIMTGLVAPMLEKMGATLTFVRGAGFDTSRVRLDDSGYNEAGTWTQGSSAGGWEGGYRVTAVNPTETSLASFSWVPTVSGEMPVYIWYVAGANRSTRARIRVMSGEHSETVFVDQTQRGERWVYLGTFTFEADIPAAIEISNLGDDNTRYVVADAVWIGGGVGSVDFGGGVSGKAYWQQSAQAQSREVSLPPSVSDPYGDVTVRPAWAIWEDVDLYLSLHTNAGGGRGTSTFVYSNQVAYPSFDPNRAEDIQPGSLEFQDAIHSRMIEAVRRYWDPDWRDRGKWGANFGELRPLTLAWREDSALSIPAMLIELAFHDSEDDTYYLREQRFREDMARAIVRGILDFVYRGQPNPAPLIPEPPADLSVTGRVGERMLRWRSRTDPIDVRSNASEYRVEKSRDGIAFFPYATTTETWLSIAELSPCEASIWRVVALNESGESLPSESMIDVAVYDGGRRILWVDGHRRWVQTVNEAPSRPRPVPRVLDGLTQFKSRGLGIDSARAETVASGEIELGQYDLVIWSVGETSTVDQSLTGAEQQAIEEYLETGGTLVLSGSEIAWHLGRSFDPEELSFFEETLGASYVADSASSYDITWTWGQSGTGNLAMQLDDGSGLYQRVGYPDVIESTLGGVTIAEYGATGEVAALWQRALNGSLFYLAFPIEAIDSAVDRTRIFQDIIESVDALASHNGVGCSEDEAVDEPTFEPEELTLTESLSADLLFDDTRMRDDSGESSGCSGCQGAGNSSTWTVLFVLWAIRRRWRRHALSQA